MKKNLEKIMAFSEKEKELFGKEEIQNQKKYIMEEKTPALWRPPCACGIAVSTELYKLYREEFEKY